METGGFDGGSLQDRLCEFCSGDAIEDDFFISINLYHDLRQTFIGEITDETTNVEDDAGMARSWKHTFENFPRQCGKFTVGCISKT